LSTHDNHHPLYGFFAANQQFSRQSSESSSVAGSEAVVGGQPDEAVSSIGGDGVRVWFDFDGCGDV
jgi:hypothetical protein